MSFESQCTTRREQGPYSSQNLERAFAIAERFQFWIIVDYHGYNDTATETTINCWLTFWSGLVQQFSSRYARTVWEPINEPMGIGYNHASVAVLSNIYQRWIDQTRLLGDTNWVVVQNLCSYRCDFSDKEDGFPAVMDPVGKVFISLHSYMAYRYYWDTWDNSTAEARAVGFYNSMTNGAARTGWQLLNTEGGAAGTFNGTQRCPDLILTGSAGYCGTNFHFMQTLTSLLDTGPQRINWVWWTVSSQTNTEDAGLYGALNTWGSILDYRMVRPPVKGDVNKDFSIDLIDLATMAVAYDSTPSSTNWSPESDITNNNIVDILDLALAASNYGRTY